MGLPALGCSAEVGLRPCGLLGPLPEPSCPPNFLLTETQMSLATLRLFSLLWFAAWVDCARDDQTLGMTLFWCDCRCPDKIHVRKQMWWIIY